MKKSLIISPCASPEASALSILTRRGFLTAAGISAASLLLAGCSGGSHHDNPGSTRAFTVTPASAAPGALVTLTGYDPGDATAIVRFGTAEAIIHGQGSDGLQVLVPPIFQDGAATPTLVAAGTAFPVSVLIGEQTTATSTNMFTTMELPPAPGRTAAVVQEFLTFTNFLQDFFQNGLLTALSDSISSPLDAAAAVQGAAFSAAVSDFLNGPDNPDSFVKTMTDFAALGPEEAALMDIIDGIMAQGPGTDALSNFAQTIYDAINEVAPDTIVSRAAALPQTRGLNLGQYTINWKAFSSAQAIIITLQMQSLLSTIASSKESNIAQILLGCGLTVITAIATGLKNAGAEKYAKLIPVLATASTIISLGGKLLSCIASTMPGLISDFYVVLKGQNRHSSDPPVDIAVSENTPLQMLIVTESGGGLAFSALGTVEVLLDVAKGLPGIGPFLSKIPEGIIDNVIKRMLSIGDTIWQLIGVKTPEEWSAKDAFNFPQFKYPKVNVNDSRVVTVISRSENLLKADFNSSNTASNGIPAHAWFLKGLKPGQNAGYGCWLSKQALVPKLPSLADLAGATSVDNAKWNVTGVVNIAGGDVQLQIS